MTNVYDRRHPALGDAERIRAVLQVLADETCREVIAELAANPADLRALTSAMGRSPEALQRPLGRLIESRLVSTEELPEGTIFRLAPSVRASAHGQHTVLSVTTEGGSEVNLRLPRS